MDMTRKQRAGAFTHLMGDLHYFSGGYPHDPDGKGDVGNNAWMKTHPDLIVEFTTFMKAFRAEVEQRFEEE